MRTIARCFSTFGLAALLAIAGSALTAAVAQAAPGGQVPTIIPALASTTSSPQVGDVLTDVSGVWSGTGTVTVAIQWLDCDGAGSNCQPIAVNATGPTYTVTAGDMSSTIEVQETATDSTGSTTLSSGPTLVVGLAPSNTSPPTISGVAQEGQTLTDTNGTWTNNPTSFSYQWLDCDSLATNCSDVAANGTGQTYTLTNADAGFTVEVQEAAFNPGGAGTPANSAPTATVIPLPPVNTVLPTISGILQQGQTLSEVTGTWTDNPTSFQYQWLRCDSTGSNCANIRNATSPTYKLTSADVGNTIEVEETAFNPGGAGTPADSAATSVITLPPPVNTSLPKIFGAAQQGQTLNETNGTWTNNPSSFSYQWLDCDSSGSNCSDVAANGTGQTYTLAGGDVGSTIEVLVNASNAGGQGNATSKPTAAITPPPTAAITPPPPPANLSLPTLIGTAQQGQTLADVNGTWTNSPTSFTYQWMDCDSAGNNCTSIANATGQTYAPTANLVGDTMRVQEVAGNSGGSSAPALSAQTPVITLNPSSTSLLAEPGSPVTDQTATLVATVTSSFVLAPPAGRVTFDAAGTPIGGCSAVAVSTLNQSVQVTCQTTFAAATTPQALTAIFAPDPGAGIAGSASQPLSLPVGRASSSTTLDVSNPTVFAGSTATYTATVATGQGGPVSPLGSVQFSDRGKPVVSCSSKALVQSQGSLSAQCKIRYLQSGRHTIAAQYSGDGNFSGSVSSSQAVKVQQRPTRIAGAITAKTFWRDYFTPTYTRFLAMVVHKLAPGATIVLICRGSGCPFARQSLLVASKACGPKAACIAKQAQAVNLVTRLGASKLRVGTVLTVELTRPNWIGKAYVITIRSGRKPSDRIQCLAPGATRPGVGC